MPFPAIVVATVTIAAAAIPGVRRLVLVLIMFHIPSSFVVVGQAAVAGISIVPVLRKALALVWLVIGCITLAIVSVALVAVAAVTLVVLIFIT